MVKEKSIKVLEVEERIGRDLESFLREEYLEKEISIKQIAGDLGVGSSSVYRWMENYDIPTRDSSEAKLPPGFIKPGKEELERMYVEERQSIRRIAGDLGVGSSSVYRWMDQYEIQTRNSSEARLPESFVIPTKEELERLYIEERKSMEEIGGILKVSEPTVKTLLEEHEIPIRSTSEAMLPEGFVKPTKEELERWYVEEGKSRVEIGRELGISDTTIGNWLEDYDIPIRNISEAKLPLGFVKPTKEELERLYIEERQVMKEIGDILRISKPTVRSLLKEYEIPIRSTSEARLPPRFVKPTKEELDQWYVEEGKSSVEIGRELGISDPTVRKFLKEYEIPIRSSPSRISSEQFISFLRKDETARNLAIAATTMNGEAYDIEKIIEDLYSNKFKDLRHVHSLLQENSAEIKRLAEEGVTNLGYYLGVYELGDRRIIPVLLGQVIATLPEEHITPSLEERLVRLLRNEYSPRFNDDSEGTMQELQRKTNSSEGKKKGLYQKLYDHYKEVLELAEELKI